MRNPLNLFRRPVNDGVQWYSAADAITLEDVGLSPSNGVHRSASNMTTYWRHYKTNPIIRAAVTEIVHALISIPMLAERYASGTWLPLEPGDRPQHILRNPAPHLSNARGMDPATFYSYLYTDLTVTANLYSRKLRGQRSREPLAFRRMDPLHIVPVLDNGGVVDRYVHNPVQIIGDREPPRGIVGESIDPSDIIHIPLDPDPDYPAIGLSAIASVLKQIDLQNAITDFTTSVMSRGAVLDKALITKQQVTDADARRIERRWQSRRSGPNNAGGLAVIDGTEGDLVNLGMSLSAREMGLVDLEKAVEALILMGMDVPPIVVGAVVGLENATYSNYGQARLAFHEENTDPNLWRVTSAFGYGLDGEYGENRNTLIRLRPDLSRVMALLQWEDQRRRLNLAEFNDGLTTQTESRAAGDRPPLDNGDWIKLPLNQQRLSPSLLGAAVPDIQQEPPDADAMRLALASPEQTTRALYQYVMARGIPHDPAVAIASVLTHHGAIEGTRTARAKALLSAADFEANRYIAEHAAER